MRTASFAALVIVFSAVAAHAAAAKQPPPKGKDASKAVEVFELARARLVEGRADLASAYLKAFVESRPTDEDLKYLQQRHGRAVFENLRNVRKWSDDAKAEAQARADVETLVKQAQAIDDRELRTDARIRQYIRDLVGNDPVERAFAEKELLRAGTFAVPIMIDVLRNTTEPDVGNKIIWLVRGMDPAGIGGWLEAFEFLGNKGAAKDDPGVESNQFAFLDAMFSRRDVIELLKDAQTDARPHLCRVVLRARDPKFVMFAVNLLRNLPADLAALPPKEDRKSAAVDALLALARRFDDRAAKFAGAAGGTAPNDPATVPMWLWDRKLDVLTEPKRVPKAQAEEYLGIRYARWVLEADPANEAAQSFILAMAAERAVERGNFGLLSRTDPATYRLLADAPPALLFDLLAKGLGEKRAELRGRRTALALAVIQVLADRAGAEGGAAAPRKDAPLGPSPTPLLVKALNYPDARVQLAATDAMLRGPYRIDGRFLPAEGADPTDARIAPGVPRRIIEILKRAITPDPDGAKMGRALIADPDPQRAAGVAAILRGMGFGAEVFNTGRDLQLRIGRSSDFDILLVDHHVVVPQLYDLVAQLRADINVAGRPILVVASPDQVPAPSLDMLLFRYALLVAVTDPTPIIVANDADRLALRDGDPQIERKAVIIPPPFVPDITKLFDDEESRRRREQANRDAGIQRVIYGTRPADPTAPRTLAQLGRLDRLTRAIDAARFRLTAAQQEQLRLKAEIVTYAIIAAEYPVTPESMPAVTVDFANLRRRLALQPAAPPYTSTIGIPEVMARLDRLELEVAKVPAVQERYVRLWEKLDPDALGLVNTGSRDLAAEARVAKALRTFRGVHVVPEPLASTGLDRDLRLAAFADPADAPRDSAEKMAAARLALGWLRKMATGEVPGFPITTDFDPRDTGAKLERALVIPELSAQAAEALARFPTAEAERALVDLALDGLPDLKTDDPRQAAIRALAADAAVRHAQRFGNAGNAKSWIADAKRQRVAEAAAREPNPDVRAVFIVLNGLLSATAKDLAGGLLNHEPALARPMPMAPMMPPEKP